MFNKTVVLEDHRPQHHYSRQDVHEHRAPTDESINLLKEFQEKAEAKVISSVAVENNLFSCVIHMHRNALDDRLVARAIFELNGNKMTSEVSVSGMDRDDKEKLIKKLHEAVSREISLKILMPALHKLKL